ncbi:Bacterial membrane flanked domain protein [Pirellula sp. SH-Sr6A]|uniref:PH domain-containing protein n=1 Tax=Pirellula sp. SH-Sr6A TaxID=1632865 RepID=UPI00078E90EE|nr:PH domain-containing protein [Pirellula sp. SH-Sr6A]AMV33952.1 Bacterial membrane flanked domain protein [Pirellula sp. SH-Sr6A]
MRNDECERTIEVDYQTLDANIVVAERMVGAMVWAVLVAAGLISWLLIAFLVLDGMGRKSLLCGLGIGLCLAGLGILFWFDPLWKHRTTRWRETDGGFELKRGYVWWHHIFVPRERIQHTDVVQGPILRRFEMATLVINTAGTHEYSISVEGLPLHQAESLRSSLLPRREIPSIVAEVPQSVIPNPQPVSHECPSEPSNAPQAIESSVPSAPLEPTVESSVEPTVKTTVKPNRLGPTHEPS